MRCIWLSEARFEILVLVAGAEQALHLADLSMALNLRPETLDDPSFRKLNAFKCSDLTIRL